MWERWIARQLGGASGAHELAFEFGVPFGIAGACLLLLVAALAATWFWWPRLGKLPVKRRALLVFLRVAMLLLVLFLLCDPVLIGRRIKRGADYVVLLFDDSRSMQIAGDDGISRARRLQEAYAAALETFETPLKAEHQIAAYRFGETTSRLQNVADLRFEERESDPVGAIQAALRDLAGATVSAVVLFSDGVPQGEAALSASVSSLVPEVPVHTVGVDSTSAWRDLELEALNVTRTAFDKSPVSLIAHVRAEGLAGRGATIEVLEGNRVVASKPLTLSTDSLEARVPLEFIPQTKDWITYQTRLRLLDPAGADTLGSLPAATPPPGTVERVMENNDYSFTIDNRQKVYRILYFSGRPNWQNKFIKQALDEDEELRMASLIRISGPDRKFEFRARTTSMNTLYEGFDKSEVVAPRYDEAVFIRLGLGESELADGYPLQAEDLYPYDLVIWAEIESEYFSPRQLEITLDYVDKRGGNFLMLGGPRTLNGGNYAGTMIESLLPVLLGASHGSGDVPVLDTFFRSQPTVEGFLSGAWTLDPDPQLNDEMWKLQPDLYGLNVFPLVRAGATELARATVPDAGGEAQPMFISQRYGLGRCAVMATGETWQWQMKVPREESVHERFWRQLVRSLVQDSPKPVVLQSRSDHITVGDEAQLDFLVRDKLFEKREGAVTTIRLTPPEGPPVDLSVEESIAEAGLYSVEFTPEFRGPHRLSLLAQDGAGEPIGELDQVVNIHPDRREFRNAAYDPSLLVSISARTGGSFTALDKLADLAGRIPRTATDDASIQTIHLWRFPVFFALLGLLFCTEWFLRRKSGQP